MSKPRRARPGAWLNVPPGPPHAKQEAILYVDFADKAGGKAAVLFDPEDAATIGKRLLDFAGRADVVTAVRAVGAVMHENAGGMVHR